MPNIREKIKHWSKNPSLEPFFMILLIVLVGFGAFGLGRLSVTPPQSKGVQVFTSPDTQVAGIGHTIVPADSQQKEGEVVASKNGSKYHYPWCSGAQRIADENKIWFNTIEEARAVGYTPAANCKGLE